MLISSQNQQYLVIMLYKQNINILAVFKTSRHSVVYMSCFYFIILSKIIQHLYMFVINTFNSNLYLISDYLIF
jgi:hypothetical protein